MDARNGIGGTLTGLDLRAEIDRLRKERNAVILAHYYQKPEIQDLADFVGDSLDLSRKAQATDADVIAFCGVRFMAETAKILGPDKNLGGYLARKTGREMLLWPGVCIVHEAFSETELLKLQLQYPGAPIAAHPECPPYILDHADYVGSTSGILAFADTMPGDTLIVATEPHIIHQMRKAAPTKNFIGAPGA